MLLMLSTLMIVRVEQFNNNDNVSVPQESPMGSAKRATARFQVMQVTYYVMLGVFQKDHELCIIFKLFQVLGL